MDSGMRSSLGLAASCSLAPAGARLQPESASSVASSTAFDEASEPDHRIGDPPRRSATSPRGARRRSADAQNLSGFTRDRAALSATPTGVGAQGFSRGMYATSSLMPSGSAKNTA